MFARAVPAVLIALAASAAPAAPPYCQPGWQPGFGFDSLYESAPEVALAAPGGREALFVGGEFTQTMHLVGLSNIAEHDGERWFDLDGGVDGPVRALVAWDPDGAGPAPDLVVAAGQFTQAGLSAATGPIAVRAVAAWDGAGWRALGDGLPGEPADLRVVDVDGDGAGELFAAARLPGVAAVFAFDGAAWREIGSWPGHAIEVLAAWAPTGAAPARLVAAAGPIVRLWDGAAWEQLPPTPLPDGRIAGAVGVDLDGAGPQPDQLVVLMGPWRYSGGVLAAFDGAAWRVLEEVSITADAFCDLVAFDPDGPGPLAPGVFYVSDERFIGEYIVATLQFHGEWPEWIPRYIGPWLYPTSRVGLALWRRRPSGVMPEMWVALEQDAWDPTVFGFRLDGSSGLGLSDAALLQTDGVSELIAIGSRGLSRHDGDAWRAWAPTDDDVRDLLVDDPDGPGPADGRLYVCGGFEEIDGVPAGGAALWADGAWSPLGAGSRYYNGLAMVDVGAGPRLHAGGARVTGSAEAGVVQWDGDAWRPVGIVSGIGARWVSEIIAHDPDGAGPAPELLVAAGRFTAIDGVPASGVALFDGARWAPADPAFDDIVDHLVSHDPDGAGPALPDLYALGDHLLYRLESGGFRLVLAPSDILDLASFDADGPGPGAPVLLAGLLRAEPGLAQLEGGQLLPFQGGLLGRAPALGYGAPTVDTIRPVEVACDGRAVPALAITGSFVAAGGQLSHGFALWVADGACVADCDASGALDFLDFLCFQGRFGAGDPRADCDGDGALTLFDYLCFQNAYAAGCP
ncbi:MAG: GC-type dockerin domain-anchored protein [Phycisphaerales bacterium JB039]